VEICGGAANGQDAIEKASQLMPDLIILDVTMPGLDGLAAARQIRTFQPEVPIIMLSMHDGQHIAREDECCVPHARLLSVSRSFSLWPGTRYSRCAAFCVHNWCIEQRIVPRHRVASDKLFFPAFFIFLEKPIDRGMPSANISRDCFFADSLSNMFAHRFD
jgi:CheY-like chemotaxis protein